MFTNKLFLSTYFFCVLLSISTCEAQHYFWADGQKHQLEPDSSILVLRNENQEAGRAVTNLTSEKIERYGECVVFRNVTRIHRKNFSDQKIEFASAYRMNSVPVIATNIVSFIPKSSIEEIEKGFRKRMRFRDKTRSGVYHYVVTNFRETLAIANALTESGLVEWCQPDFVIEIKTTSVDPLYEQQYYLNNTGQNGGLTNIDINAPEAWAISKGCYPTRVAVLDLGVEPHEDLGARYQTGFTALNPSGVGLPPNSGAYHGQACAGIIAASHDNNLGIAGISPTSIIIPVNGIIGSTSVFQIADGINAGWDPTRGNADVLSNSWSWANAPSLSEITHEISEARTKGRGLKGTIVVFSAGNGGGGVEFPANRNGVITVGAINKFGDRWSYSTTGNSMDLVAPSGNTNQTGDITTFDLSDDLANNGDNRGLANGNYLSNFGGTSAAAPQAAGVAALILSVNPDLTEEQVRTILQQSATDMGPIGFDQGYGYGRVNAYAALRATVGSIGGTNLLCKTSPYSLETQLQNILGVNWTSSNPNGLSIDFNSGIATRQNNFNGIATITATFTTPCVSANLTKDVWVGSPNQPLSLSVPVSDLCLQEIRSLSINPVGGASTYNWNPSGSGISLQSSTTEYNVITGEALGDDSFDITATNACGTNSNTYAVSVVECGNCGVYPFPPCDPMLVATFPNPADDEITVSLNEKYTASDSKLDLNIELMDNYGLKRREISSNKQNTMLSLRDLPKGLYYLKIHFPKGTITLQIAKD